MKVSPLGKKAFFFNFQKKSPYRVNLFKIYKGSLQLKALRLDYLSHLSCHSAISSVLTPTSSDSRTSYLSEITPKFCYLAKICYNLINNKSSEFITLNEKAPCPPRLRVLFCASYNTLAFVKSDTISCCHRSAFQSTSYHRLSPTRTLRATLLGQQQEE